MDSPSTVTWTGLVSSRPEGAFTVDVVGTKSIVQGPVPSGAVVTVMAFDPLLVIVSGSLGHEPLPYRTNWISPELPQTTASLPEVAAEEGAPLLDVITMVGVAAAEADCADEPDEPPLLLHPATAATRATAAKHSAAARRGATGMNRRNAAMMITGPSIPSD